MGQDDQGGGIAPGYPVWMAQQQQVLEQAGGLGTMPGGVCPPSPSSHAQQAPLVGGHHQGQTYAMANQSWVALQQQAVRQRGRTQQSQVALEQGAADTWKEVASKGRTRKSTHDKGEPS